MAVATDPNKAKNTIGQEQSAKAGLESGLWRHPETGAEAATQYDPLFGHVQAEAFYRAGFRRVGDTPEGYVVEMTPAYADALTSSGSVSNDELKGMHARLALLEQELVEAKKLPVENSTETAAQEAALAATRSRLGELPTEVPADKPFKSLNKGELIVLGASKGLALDPNLSNAELRKAIESAE